LFSSREEEWPALIGITALRDGCWHIKCVDVVNQAHNQERARERKERTVNLDGNYVRRRLIRQKEKNFS
jgi:hypothetical protein